MGYLKGFRTVLLGVVIALAAMTVLIPQAAASHCGGFTTQSTDSDSCNDDEYDDDENYKCSTTEDLTDGDMDGDGTNDCQDADDDGDALSDKLEREHGLYDYQDDNTDNDVVDDGFDIKPGVETGAIANAVASGYDAVDCTGELGEPSDKADPYIPDGELVISYGVDDIVLPEPEGWQEGEGNHVEERDQDVVSDLLLDDDDVNGGNGDVTENTLDLPDDIREFPGDTENGIPRITLQVGLIDHDEFDDDRMDLSGDGNKAQFEYPLTIDKTTTRVEDGDGSAECDSGLTFDFSDNNPKTAVRAAVYHRDNADNVVETTDI